jgi:RHS repeat-associated protein
MAKADIIALVNSSGKVERTFRYGRYGENVKSEGTQTIPYPFGYKGGYRMPGGNKGEGNVANGLYHYGQRYYDPTTGRWTQQDPLGHLGSTTQGDRFLFAGVDPINQSDPFGLSAEAYELACGSGVKLKKFSDVGVYALPRERSWLLT